MIKIVKIQGASCIIVDRCDTWKQASILIKKYRKEYRHLKTGFIATKR